MRCRTCWKSSSRASVTFLQADVPPNRRRAVGLEAVFRNIFPIIDNRETHILEYVDYQVERPKYDEDECRERGVTFQAALKGETAFVFA
jgi:DNA-directed RNA polymerase subunit beta